MSCKLIVMLFFLSFHSLKVISQNKRPARIPIIFDTDFGPDYDDVGAITLLHAFADQGLIRILATGGSCSYKNVGPAISVFNTYFKRPDLPIGIVKGKSVDIGDWQHWSDTIIARYPHRIHSNDDLPDAVSIYRQQLAKQADHSVVIITVGFLTNMANLLKSAPDRFSRLTGRQLVLQKVKELVSMAGSFPEGMEFNLSKDPQSSGFVYGNWPTRVLFTGFEIGRNIHCGLPLINNTAIHYSPVKDVFSISIPKAKEDSLGRMSWDETAVLIAATGYRTYYNVENGHIVCFADGHNSWNSAGEGQAYIKEKISPVYVQKIINELLQHQPLKHRK
jgi:pyrimidine-specific ribonucleoside hydrolase